VAAVGNPDPLEFSDVRATEAKLKPLVEASGGRIMWLSDNPEPSSARCAPAEPPAARTGSGCGATKGIRWRGDNQLPLLPGILVALAFLMAIGSAWWREVR
jgi:hypothetical protein